MNYAKLRWEWIIITFSSSVGFQSRQSLYLSSNAQEVFIDFMSMTTAAAAVKFCAFIPGLDPTENTCDIHKGRKLFFVQTHITKSLIELAADYHGKLFGSSHQDIGSA